MESYTDSYTDSYSYQDSYPDSYSRVQTDGEPYSWDSWDSQRYSR